MESPFGMEVPEPTPETSAADGGSDLPAYIAAGLPSRDKMKDIQRMYFYDPLALEGTDEYETYGTKSGTTISADLDGNGKNETIEFLPASKEYEGEGTYKKITVKINGKPLTLKAPDYCYFNLDNDVVDIDRNDGKKEIYIPAYTDDDRYACLVAYNGGKPKLIFKNWHGFYYPLGTGYILHDQYRGPFKRHTYVASIVLKHLKSDHSGFETVNTKYLLSIEGALPNKINPDSDELAKAQWNQKVAKKPGGKESIRIKKGKVIWLGLFDPRGWMQILDRNGKQLGWLNLKKVDYMKFTGDAFAWG